MLAPKFKAVEFADSTAFFNFQTDAAQYAVGAKGDMQIGDFKHAETPLTFHSASDLAGV